MLTGKKIVLTGATSGIGYEVLKLLVKGDNKILAIGRNLTPLESFDKSKVIPFYCDVSTKEGVDSVFEKAISEFGKIDIFYCNAGYANYEKFTYVDWERTESVFNTNVLSVIYSYQKYYEHVKDQTGHFAITVSAIGKMAVPGYAIYSASKFALQGFQEAIRLERHKNVKLTCLYPVATNTHFFRDADKPAFKRPFPVQQPEIVAKAMVKGLEKGKKTVNPCKLFVISEVLMTLFPFVKKLYLAMEYKKLKRFTDANKK